MIFSKTCEYAIRATMFIAQKTKDGQKVNIKEIAQGIDSPEHFIAKILQDLSRRGYLQSAKGPGGGFYLDGVSRQRSMIDIVLAIDGDRLFLGCGLGLKQCSEQHPCPIHEEFQHIRKNIRQMLEQAKLGEFTDQLEQKLAFLKKT